MSLVWTKSNKLGSKLIRDMTKSKSSHMAWFLDEHLVFHSNHKGCHPEWKERFLKENEIVFQIDLDLLSLPEEEELYLELLRYDGLPYDNGALIYQGLAWIGYKLNIANQLV